MSRSVTIIGVPLDLGAGRRGVDMGPSAFRVADIHQRIRDLGYDVQDAGDVEVDVAETRDPGNPKLKYLAEIRGTCEKVRERVKDVAWKGSIPVTLGGDHSLAMGSIAGMSAFHGDRGKPIGLIWFDAHADSNSAETSPSGNIHGMPLAVALGIGDPSLTGLSGKPPMVDGPRAALVAIRAVDPAVKGIGKAS